MEVAEKHYLLNYCGMKDVKVVVDRDKGFLSMYIPLANDYLREYAFKLEDIKALLGGI